MRRAEVLLTDRATRAATTALGGLLCCVLAGCGAENGGGAETDGELATTTSESATQTEPATEGGATGPGSGSATSGATLSSTSGATADGDTDASRTDGDETDSGQTGDDSSGVRVEPPPGLPCEQTFEHEGRQGCQSVIEGLEVKFFPLEENVPAERLVVFLHGDGGDDYTSNWGFRREILDWAVPQNFLVVGVRSPASYEGETAPSFGAAQPSHADMVATTLEAFVDGYEVLHEQALYWGISGGSWFTTSSYIAVAGHRVPGVFVANCGGSGNSFGWAWDPATDATNLALNAVFLNYGDQDFLAEPSAQSYAEYTQLGFVTDQLVHRGATHCAHPISEPTLEFWMSQM